MVQYLVALGADETLTPINKPKVYSIEHDCQNNAALSQAVKSGKDYLEEKERALRALSEVEWRHIYLPREIAQLITQFVPLLVP